MSTLTPLEDRQCKAPFPRPKTPDRGRYHESTGRPPQLGSVRPRETELTPGFSGLDDRFVTKGRKRYSIEGTIAVMKRKNFPSEGQCRYCLWADEGRTVRRKGLRLVKVTNRLETARNVVYQAAVKGGKKVAETVMAELVIYDPEGRIDIREVGRTSFVRDPHLTFDQWVKTLPDQTPPGRDPPPMTSPNKSTTEGESAREEACNTTEDTDPDKETLTLTLRQEPGNSPPGGADSRTSSSTDPASTGALLPKNGAKQNENSGEGKGGSEGKEDSSLPEMNQAPTRFEITSGGRTHGEGAANPVTKLLQRTKTMGSLLEAHIAGLRHTNAWFHDPGCEISQISWKAAQECWSSLTPLGSARVRCCSTSSSTIMDLQLYRLKGWRLCNSSTGDKGPEWSIELLVNPLLKVHPYILGLNTIKQLRLVVDHRRSIVKMRECYIGFPMRSQHWLQRLKEVASARPAGKTDPIQLPTKVDEQWVEKGVVAAASASKGPSALPGPSVEPAKPSESRRGMGCGSLPRHWTQRSNRVHWMSQAPIPSAGSNTTLPIRIGTLLPTD